MQATSHRRIGKKTRRRCGGLADPAGDGVGVTDARQLARQVQQTENGWAVGGHPISQTEAQPILAGQNMRDLSETRRAVRLHPRQQRGW